jgi:hypothetical protein
VSHDGRDRYELVQGPARAYVIGDVLSPGALSDADGPRVTLETRGHLARMLAARIVAVSNDDHIASGESLPCCDDDTAPRVPLPRSPRIARGCEASTLDRVYVLLPLDNVGGPIAVVRDELRKAVRYAAHVAELPHVAVAVRVRVPRIVAPLPELLSEVAHDLEELGANLVAVRIDGLDLEVAAVRCGRVLEAAIAGAAELVHVARRGRLLIESARVLFSRATAPHAVLGRVAHAALALPARVLVLAAAHLARVRANVALVARNRCAHVRPPITRRPLRASRASARLASAAGA